MGGSSTVNQPGVYGKLGTPAAGNIPGGRDNAATWTDSSGNFWLFGGVGFDTNGNFGYLNDLWEFNPSTDEWTWMGGSSTVPASCAGSTTVTCGQPGVYGTLNSAAAANVPGGRDSVRPGPTAAAISGFSAAMASMPATFWHLNDLWEFNPTTKEWTWMGGSSTHRQQWRPARESTGPLAPPLPQISPVVEIPPPAGSTRAANSGSMAAKASTARELRSAGRPLGVRSHHPGVDVDGRKQHLARRMRHQRTMGSAVGPPSTAHSDVSAPGIGPGSRVAAVGWTDGDGNLWLFGGLGSVFWENRDFSEIDQYDLWEFNPSTQQWAWMSGNSTSICGESSSEWPVRTGRHLRHSGNSRHRQHSTQPQQCHHLD